MNIRIPILLFLTLWIARPAVSWGDVANGDVISAFNQSIDEEAKHKIQEAEEAERGGNIRKSQMLIRQAMLLETLRVEEEKTSEEKLIALRDQMPEGEKKEWIKRFISEGDQLARLGLYDIAVDEYEKVFLLDPENHKASDRIDRLRKQFIKEQHATLKEQDKVFEEDYKKRTEILLNQANELMDAGNYSSAKRTLERLLAVEPKNKKAKKLLKEAVSRLDKEKKA